jgi:acetyl esterase/lipase
VAAVHPPIYEVRSVRDQAYYEGPDANRLRHRLDLFLPKDKENFPVLFFVHGGAWFMGDKSLFGRYSEVGKCLARHGIGAVLPNYRLSPGVKHPEHIRDVARAFAWTVRNIKNYGGDPTQLFVGGHSAGGHLCTLLATDPIYLKNEGIDTSLIKGIVAVSGVYQFLDVGLELKGLVPGGNSFAILPKVQLNFHAHEAEPDIPKDSLPTASHFNLLDFVFGSDPSVRKDAFPMAHVHAGLPPFLLVNASHDLPGLLQMADEFASALRKEKCDVQTMKIPGRTHFGVMFRAKTADDPLAQAIIDFVYRHAKDSGAAAGGLPEKNTSSTK